MQYGPTIVRQVGHGYGNIRSQRVEGGMVGVEGQLLEARRGDDRDVTRAVAEM